MKGEAAHVPAVALVALGKAVALADPGVDAVGPASHQRSGRPHRRGRRGRGRRSSPGDLLDLDREQPDHQTIENSFLVEHNSNSPDIRSSLQEEPQPSTELESDATSNHRIRRRTRSENLHEYRREEGRIIGRSRSCHLTCGDGDGSDGSIETDGTYDP